MDNEQKVKVQQLQQSSASQSSIEELQQIISQKEEERNVLRQQLNEMELELNKTLDDHQRIMQEKDTLIQQHRDEVESVSAAHLDELVQLTS